MCSIIPNALFGNPLTRRAMAASFGIAPSTLCEVLKGTQPLSIKMATKLCKKLALSDEETDYFLVLVRYAHSQDPEQRAYLQKKIQTAVPGVEVRDLSIDAFKMMSDWYHVPMLELTQIPGFEFVPEKIARALGITKVEADVAIERLERLEMLEKDAQGRYLRTNAHWVTKSVVPNAAFRKFNQQFIQKGLESLETQTPTERFTGSETFAFNKSAMAEAEKILEECFSRMVALSTKVPTPDHVYHLNINFFRVTRKSEEK